jgi:hypothetical protein
MFCIVFDKLISNFRFGIIEVLQLAVAADLSAEYVIWRQLRDIRRINPSLQQVAKVKAEIIPSCLTLFFCKYPLSILQLFTHFLYEKLYKIFSNCPNNTSCWRHLVGNKKWLVVASFASYARQYN